MAENFADLGRDLDIHVYEVIGPQTNLTPRSFSNHITIKLFKIKDKGRLLKAAREKKILPYKETSTRLSADFSAETLQARREWDGKLKMLKERKYQPRMLYPTGCSSETEVK